MSGQGSSSRSNSNMPPPPRPAPLSGTWPPTWRYDSTLKVCEDRATGLPNLDFEQYWGEYPELVEAMLDTEENRVTRGIRVRQLVVLTATCPHVRLGQPDVKSFGAGSKALAEALTSAARVLCGAARRTRGTMNPQSDFPIADDILSNWHEYEHVEPEQDVYEHLTILEVYELIEQGLDAIADWVEMRSEIFYIRQTRNPQDLPRHRRPEWSI